MTTPSVTDESLRKLLLDTGAIAVVGLSADPSRPSHGVASYLQGCGYRIMPVNPTLDNVLGERCFARLEDIDQPVGIVNVFRRSAEVLPLAEATVALATRLGIRAFWQQLGVANVQADALVRQAGLVGIVDRCIKIDHARLLGRKADA